MKVHHLLKSLLISTFPTIFVSGRGSPTKCSLPKKHVYLIPGQHQPLHPIRSISKNNPCRRKATMRTESNPRNLKKKWKYESSKKQRLLRVQLSTDEGERPSQLRPLLPSSLSATPSPFSLSLYLYPSLLFYFLLNPPRLTYQSHDSVVLSLKPKPGSGS
jgi:hypothetical protein